MLSQKTTTTLSKALRLGRARTGVVGVDYGFVYQHDERLKKRGIRFHVAQKLPLTELPPEHVLPSELDDVRCDVVEARYSLHGNPREQCDPLQLGVSVGNVQRFTTGTMGYCVRDRYSGRPGFVSNWHVLCGSPDARASEPISQPGPMHQGTSPARIAATVERFTALDVGCDAALALLVPGVEQGQSLFENGLGISGSELPRLGTHLLKFGATSLLTHGLIDGVDGSYQVDYSAFGDTKRWIDGIRIVVDPAHPEPEISLAGDSGAAWVNPETRKAVAMHFGGEDGLGPTAEYALALPIRRVLELLDLELA